jgi:hypothetical protein
MVAKREVLINTKMAAYRSLVPMGKVIENKYLQKLFEGEPS